MLKDGFMNEFDIYWLIGLSMFFAGLHSNMNRHRIGNTQNLLSPVILSVLLTGLDFITGIFGIAVFLWAIYLLSLVKILICLSLAFVALFASGFVLHKIVYPRLIYSINMGDIKVAVALNLSMQLITATLIISLGLQLWAI